MIKKHDFQEGRMMIPISKLKVLEDSVSMRCNSLNTFFLPPTTNAGLGRAGNVGLKNLPYPCHNASVYEINKSHNLHFKTETKDLLRRNVS